MKRRAEQVDETREHITEAAVRLHTTVGPAHTTIAGVAKEAGVTRLTVYRHFADLDQLFAACMGHWAAANPMPGVEAWAEMTSPGDRYRRAFGELYAWYAERSDELYPILRDFEAMPASARAATAAMFDAVALAIAGRDADVAAGEGVDVTVAVARHLADYWTWRSLVVGSGLSVDAAADAAVAMLAAVDG